VKRAARGSLKIQHATNRQKVAIWAPSQTLSGYIFATACIDNRKKNVNHQYLLHMSS